MINLQKELFISLFKQHTAEIHALSSSMDPASMAKQSYLNPPEKSKTPIKYKHIF